MDGSGFGVALLTGGSRGIGAATARALAAAGWDVAITYRSRADAAEAVVSDCRAVGRRAAAVQADLASPDASLRCSTSSTPRLGLSLLVNNAGVVSAVGAVETSTAERVERVLRINVVAAFLAAGAAVRRMSTAAGGRAA